MNFVHVPNLLRAKYFNNLFLLSNTCVFLLPSKLFWFAWNYCMWLAVWSSVVVWDHLKWYEKFAFQLVLLCLFILRATVDINLKHILLEKKTEHDIHCRKLREKDRDLKYVWYCNMEPTPIYSSNWAQRGKSIKNVFINTSFINNFMITLSHNCIIIIIIET